jgi:hypothetical protein
MCYLNHVSYLNLPESFQEIHNMLVGIVRMCRTSLTNSGSWDLTSDFNCGFVIAILLTNYDLLEANV